MAESEWSIIEMKDVLYYNDSCRFVCLGMNIILSVKLRLVVRELCEELIYENQ